MSRVELLSRRRGSGFAAPLLVARPVDRLIPSELVQVPPGEQPGVMAVIEHDALRVVVET